MRSSCPFIVSLMVFFSCVASADCLQADEELGYIPKPNCSLKLEFGKSDSLTVQLNALGLRNRDVAEKPQKNTVRILLLGPLADGRGLRDDQLVSALMEDNLRRTGIKNVEVINGGVPGFFAGRNYLWFKRVYNAYRPHLVFYLTHLTQAVDDFNEWGDLELDEFSRPKRIKPALKQVPSDYYARLDDGFDKSSALWLKFVSAYRAAPRRKDYEGSLMRPLVLSTSAMGQLLPMKGRIYFTHSFNPVHNGWAYQGAGRFLSFFFRLLTPKIYLDQQKQTEILEGRTNTTILGLDSAFKSFLRSEVLKLERGQAYLAPRGSELMAGQLANVVAEWYEYEHRNPGQRR